MKVKLLWIALSAMVVAGCNTKNSASKSDDDKEVIELETKVFTFALETERYDAAVSIEMPVGGDEELGDSIFAFINETMCEQQSIKDLNEYRNKGQALVDFIGEKICTELNDGWESYNEGVDEEYAQQMEEHIKYSVLEDNDKYVTYLYEYDNFYDGEGYFNSVGATFLKDDCSRVTNEFLFKDPSSQKLLTLVVNTLTDKYCKGDDAFLENSELDYIDVLPNSPFYVTADGLGFFYGMNEVHWMRLEGVIPWEKVKNLLTDEAQELF